jgi:hypothetical protein
MRIQTPAQIQTLLHYWCVAPTPPKTYDPTDDATKWLFDRGAICREGNTAPPRYTVTKKGEAWVLALCRVEEPREVYVDEHGDILE